MPFRDSIDKIVTSYLAGVTSVPFEYRRQTFFPKEIYVSPLLFRGFTCPDKCGGCCPKFSLDYLPTDDRVDGAKPRDLTISRREIRVYSDIQTDNTSHFCRNLDLTTGRCGIYHKRPFSCDFELIRFLHYENRVILIQKLFGRGWAMRRIDGGHGALCEMLEPNSHWIGELSRKLNRLQEWADYFNLETRTESILEWVESGPHSSPLRLSCEDQT